MLKLRSYWFAFSFAIALSASVNLFTTERSAEADVHRWRLLASSGLFLIAGIGFALLGWLRQQIDDQALQARAGSLEVEQRLAFEAKRWWWVGFGAMATAAAGVLILALTSP